MPNAIREQLPMGVHRERLATSKTHRRFVDSTKAALQKWALEKFTGRSLLRQSPLGQLRVLNCFCRASDVMPFCFC
jgi:hypothetical protein